MANGAGIPKTMNIVPEVIGVNRFVADTQKVQQSVNKMVNGVNTSLGRLKTSSTVLASTGTSIQKVSSSINSGLSNLNRWSSGFDATNNSLTRFGSNLDQIGQRIGRMSFQLERMGRGLVVGVTLPIVAAGFAMVKAGKDFESALVKVETLVGINEETVTRWGNAILDTAYRLSVLPNEMAEGLFNAASGFGSVAATAPVMEVLREVTKGVAVGLGDAGDVARATTGIMNAFRDQAISASEAVSLLVVGVREGNLELPKLATALGNVLGTASAVGAGADDAVAFISAYTRFGVEPARAVTALNTALTNLIKPSEKNRAILDSYELTTDKIKAIIGGPGGLAELFVRMRESMAEEDFLSIFSQRSLRAILAVTDLDNFANEYRRIAGVVQLETENIFETMAANTETGSQVWSRFTKEAIESSSQFVSAVDAAFLRVSDTLEFKINQIRSLIQTIFIGADSAIAPFLKDFADQIIGSLESVNEFVRANQETVRVIIKVAGALALLGPGLIIFARLGQAVGFFLSVFGNFFRIVGYGIGVIVNFSTQLAVLAANVGGRLVQGFLLLGQLIFTATIRLAAFAAAQIAAAGGQLIGTLGALISGFASLAVTVGGVVLALGAIGSVVLVAVGALSQLWETVRGAANAIAGSFSGHVEQARDWGSSLMSEFNKGILDGLIELVNILNQIGQILAHWLAPGSPPRIAPDIDQWGTATMQEWIDGWLKADFDAFNTIFDRVQQFLQSLVSSTGEDVDQGAIGRILLGLRGSLAEAINQINEFGEATRETLGRVYSAIGSTTAELENYIEAVLAAAASTNQLGKAQQRVNEINERYSALLDPIKDQLEEINRQREGVSDDRELERLERIISRGNLPEQVERLARLRITEIGLQRQQRALEGERDAELSVAETHLREAEAANDIAQKNLVFAEEALGLQTKGLDIMAQINKSVDDIKETIKKIPKKLDAIAGGALGELGPLELPGGAGDIFGEGGTLGSVIGEADRKLQVLKDSITGLGETWGQVWTNMILKISEWWATVSTTLNNFKSTFDTKFGSTIDALKTEGIRTWQNLRDVLVDFWVQVEPGMKEFAVQLGIIGEEATTNAPAAIKVLSDTINEYLIPALDKVLQFVAVNPIAKLFASFVIAGPALVGISKLGEIGEIIDKIRAGTGGEGDSLSRAIQSLSDGIVEFASGASESVINFLNAVTDEDGKVVNFIQSIYDLTDTGFGGLSAGISSNRTALLLLGVKLVDIKNKVINLKNLAIVVLTNAIERLRLKKEEWREKTEELITWVNDLASSIIDNLLSALSDLYNYINDNVNIALESLRGLFEDIYNWIADKIQGAIDGLATSFGILGEAISTLIEPLESVATLLERVWNWVQSLPGWIIDWIKRGAPNIPLPSPGDTPSGGIPQGISSPAPIDIVPLNINQAVAGIPSFGGSFSSGRTGTAPTVVPGAGSTVAVDGGVALSFGTVIINNDMDMAAFEARVRNVVLQSMTG